MSRKLVFISGLFFLLFSFLCVRYNSVDVKAPISYPVHNLDTGLNYTSIQAAINANETLDEHTIFVEEGMYYEDVVVNKSISLFGENKSTVIIDGDGTATSLMKVTAKNVTVTGFTFQNAEPYFGYGIYVASKDNNISHNVIAHNGFGLTVSGYSGNVISRNNVTGNDHGGIGIFGSGNNVFENNVERNERGIGIQFASNNTISRNIILNNDWGINVDHSSNNTICQNTITSNAIGIYFLWNASENRFHHNNFIDNTNQVNFWYSYSNTWNSSFEGNYWDNYTGLDLDSDGIGDSPHVINVNNTDNYPLMGLFSDFNATSEQHVQTISNSTISNFQFNGTAISFNVYGENDTTGFCRICIPTALMNETYKVFVNGTEVSYDLLPISNSTHSYLYFTYNHATQEIIIIPELPTNLILPLFIVTILLAALLHRKNHSP